MLEIAIMIEGQDGLTWQRWGAIARAVEDLGFAGLFRSDHFTNAEPPDKDSLELWVSLTWLASHTQRIEFGPLVSPVSFRHPALTARMAAAVDDLSGGRLTLGIGAGWQVREHHKFGFDLFEPEARFTRFQEGVEVISRLLTSSEPVDFSGEFFRLRQALLLPRPARLGGPPILIGGNGAKRTLPLAARYAGEWNGVYLSPQEFERLNRRLDELLIEQSRQPADVRRSMVTGVIFGRSEQELREKAAQRGDGTRTPEELRRAGLIVGAGAEIRDQLSRLEDLGLQRIMLQWLDMDDLPRLEALARSLL